MSDETIVCSQCGAVNDPGANYCYQCGANLVVQRAAAAQSAPADQAPPAPPSPVPAQPAEPTIPPTPETSQPEPVQPEQPTSAPSEPSTPAAETAPPEPGIPAAPLPAAPTEPAPDAAAPPPLPPPAGATGTGASPEWPFEVPTHQEETDRPGGPPPPPSAPAAWTGQASGSQPLTENVTSSARYIVLAGIGLLVLSCLWVFLSIGTHLQARFGIFCLAPLGLIFLVVGLFLLLSRSPNRRA